MLMLLASPLLGLLSATRATPVPSDAFYWSLRNATNAAGAPLSYEERALALAFQGIVNATEEPAVVKTLLTWAALISTGQVSPRTHGKVTKIATVIALT